MIETAAPHALSALHARLGLTRNPFPPTPDASSYFFTEALESNFYEVLHCLQARKGFVLLTGEVGLGKSTFVRWLLDTLPPEETRTALVFNTFLQGEALLSAILRDFGLAPGVDMDEALARLNLFLIAQHQMDRICLLVIDDAQNLEPASLELIRLLCNLETDQEKLLQILLAGQPELEVMLDSISLRQLKSRVVKHARLSGLPADEVSRYFEVRIAAAGAEGRFCLRPSAARLLHRATGGNLRRLHLLLDRCLYGLAAQGREAIDSALVRAAINDIAIRPVSRPWRRVLRATLGLSGLGLVALGVGAVAIVWTPDQLPQLPISAVTLAVDVPAVAPPAVALLEAQVDNITPPLIDLEADTRRDCLLAIVAQAGSEPLVGFKIPNAAVTHLRNATGLCMFRRGDEHWAAWRDTFDRHTLTGQKASSAGMELQVALVRHGVLEPALVDGLLGPKTAFALGAFQAAIGLPVTAESDPLTVMLLGRMDPINAATPN